MTITPGTRLGPYEILSSIGAGGMGEVYRARDARLGRDVAVKILPTSFASDPERRARFEREGRSIAALSHPNILAVHDVGEFEGHPFLVTELLTGETLRARLTATGPLPVREAVDIAVQIARGLAAAHEKGIIHRDLKPENVILLADNHVKILDFGLALPISSGAGATETGAAITDPGVVMGTVGYMAPEQVRGQAVTERTDLFALGVVLYEMLSGQRAFERHTSADTMSAILTADPPELTGSRADVSPALDRIVRRLLEKNPAARFQDALDVAFALEALSGSSNITRLGAETQPARRPWTRIATGAVLLLAGAAVGAGVVYVRNPRLQAPPRSLERLTMLLPEGHDLPTDDSSQFAISPDGRYVVAAVYDTTDATPSRLWVRTIDDMTPRALSGTESAFNPFWSPDSQSIAFFASGKLKRIAVTGGDPKVICDAPDGRGGTWNARGDIVFAPSNSGGLEEVSASGGEPKVVTTVDTVRGETDHRFPAFLPDGRHFLFSVLPAHLGTIEIDLGSTDGGSRRKLLDAESSVTVSALGYLLYARHDGLVAQQFDAAGIQLIGDPIPLNEGARNRVSGTFAHPIASVSNEGTLAYLAEPFVATSMVSLDLAGRATPLPAPPGHVIVADVTRDGRRVALMRLTPEGQSDIWTLELGGGGLTRIASGSGVYGGSQMSVIWSPDATEIAFANNREGPYDLFVKSATDPQAPERKVPSSDAQFKELHDWPDRGQLLFGELSSKGGADAFALPLTGDQKPRLLLQSGSSSYFTVRVSPDGKWMCYISDESGSLALYVTTFPTPSARYYVGPATYGWPAWNRAGTSIGWGDVEGRISVVEVNTRSGLSVGPRRTLTTLPRNVRSWRLTPDFDRVLASVSLATPSRPSITVVTGGLGALRKNQ